MAEIIPFRSIYFDQKKTGRLDKVTCPPYDIISPKEQEYFYRLHPHNVIRLILGRRKRGDSKNSNRNIRADNYFQSWLNKGILKKNQAEIIYVYRQKYTYRNKVYRPLGFVALCRLEGWRRKKVLPHEVILDKHKTDRLQLLRKTKANFESILSLYPHSLRIEKILKKAVKKPPWLKVIDKQKVEHSIYRLSNPADAAVIKQEMKKRSLFIADGHHRYQAALDFSRETARSKSASRLKGANYLMVTFMALAESGLTIFPTHRVVYKAVNFSPKPFFKALEPHFEVQESSSGKFYRHLAASGEESTSFGLCLGKNGYYIIKLKPRLNLKNLIKEKRSLAWKKLDVTILHRLIIDKLLNIVPGEHISYTRRAKEAEKEVKSGRAQMAFFLNPTKIEEIEAVASRGERMPPKSTYFYPKLRSGLLMREIDN